MSTGSFITDRRTLAALLAIDDIVPSLLIAASDPGRLYKDLEVHPRARGREGF